MTDIQRLICFTRGPDTPLRCRLLWHTWEPVRDTGTVVYEACAPCGARRARQVNTFTDGRPVILDRRWVEAGEWTPGAAEAPFIGLLVAHVLQIEAAQVEFQGRLRSWLIDEANKLGWSEPACNCGPCLMRRRFVRRGLEVIGADDLLSKFADLPPRDYVRAGE